MGESHREREREGQPARPGRGWSLPRHGRYWVATTAALSGVGFFRGINLLLVLGYVLLGLLAANLLLAGRGLGRLRARRRFGGPVFAGTPCAVEVVVANPGRRALLGVGIEDGGAGGRGGATPPLRWFAARLEVGKRSFRGEVVVPA